MTSKVSTCLYMDREVIETAKKVGLNISKVSENALIEAIGKLTGTEPRNSLQSRPPVNIEGRGRDLNRALGSTGL
jgi:post-segregation antitoxin (ccd killing protein)